MAIDPDDRELLMSVGAAIANIRIAAAHFGFTTSVRYDARPDHALVASITVCETCLPDPHLASLFTAIPKRHTNRALFDHKPIDSQAWARVRGVLDSVAETFRTVLPEEKQQAAELIEYAERLQFSVASESVETFLAKFAAGGGVAEEMIEARDVRSPSVQLRINPRREVILASTHEQLLGGPCKQVFLGCVFPADAEYRIELQRQALIIGHALAARGVIGRLSIDFLATRNEDAEPWRLTAIEINLRMGGTTHPTLALRFLTGGEVDPVSGLLHGLDGQPKYYHSSDNVQSDSYRGLIRKTSSRSSPGTGWTSIIGPPPASSFT